MGEDVRIGFTGRPDNLIGEELKRVRDHTEPGRLVDVGGHSLGTSLITSAFDGDDTLQDRVNQTYLFNPAMSPLTENVTQEYVQKTLTMLKAPLLIFVRVKEKALGE